MTIQIYSIGDVKKDLENVGRLFLSDDTLGGINSRHIKSLEEKFFNLTKKQSVFLNSCTNGIYLALKRLNVSKKYVVIPPITFFGIAGAVLKAGGIPLYSRVDNYGLMDSGSVRELLLNYNIAAIIPSHINNRYVKDLNFENVVCIEDAAPAFGLKTEDNQCLIASSKNTAVISFSYGKPLTAGEGGMIFTDKNDENWYKGQRYCGLDNLDGQYGYGSFNVIEPDLKFSNTALNAAIVSIKLRSLNKDIEKAKEIAKYYHDMIGNYHEGELYENGNHRTYVILSDKKNKLIQELDNNAIKSYSSHRPLFYNDAFKNFDGATGYVNTTEKYFQKVLHVPCRSDLTDSEVNLIAETLKKAFQL